MICSCKAEETAEGGDGGELHDEWTETLERIETVVYVLVARDLRKQKYSDCVKEI